NNSFSLYKGIRYVNESSNVLYFKALEEKFLTISSSGDKYISALHDVYVDPEPNVNGYLLTAYLVCNTPDGLISFKLTTTEGNPFGKCSECIKPNLILNGDFDFDNGSDLVNNYKPDFHNGASYNTVTTGNIRSLNALTIGSNLPTTSAINYTVVTYNNYFEHLNETNQPTPLVPFWPPLNYTSNFYTSQNPTKGMHSIISEAAAESMTGNFLLARVKNGSSSADIWEQEPSVIIVGGVEKDYELSFDVFNSDFLEGCTRAFKVSILNGDNESTYIFDNKINNIYPLWERAHRNTPYTQVTTFL
ncbi:MAG: hypothetical protein JKY48_17585, partial [Flavobacteriales bacterium]|nr:hypothetical protein [Flavobacteriales bacterium]